MKYEIYVTLRNGILDKAGNAIAKVLDERYGGVTSVRIGKTIRGPEGRRNANERVRA